MDVHKRIIELKTPKVAVAEARENIIKERDGEQYGLKVNFPSVNIAMGKYFRFNNVNLFAGLSGHGKSYLMNILSGDFLDYKKGGINEDITFIPIIFNFCFEMSAYNEILRSVAGDMGVSYGYLLSSEYDKVTGEYNQLTDDELIKVEEYLKFYENKSILFFETPGNCKVIENTVLYYVKSYEAKAKESGVTYKYVINIDHTLLIDTLDEKSALELMANVGKLAIRLRKGINAMVNLLGQLNNNIEDVKRITNKALHYPIKSDIYAQGQLYNACDSVFIIHQPQLLKIIEYGTQKQNSGSIGKPTKDLIHFMKLKARHGKVGSIWLHNDLSKGRIIEKPKELTPIEEDKNLNEIK